MGADRYIIVRHLKENMEIPNTFPGGNGCMTEEKNLSPQPENGIQPKSLDLMRGMRWCSHLLYHRYNLNFSRNKILYLIYRRGPMTQKALMDELRIQAGSLSEMLSKMEQLGYIERTRCEHDKRNCMLNLTQSGREQALQFEKERRDMAEFLFEPLSETEKDLLHGMLEKLIEHWSQRPEELSSGEKEKENANS